jgi:SAM-dependent methyltransferase
MADVIRPYVAQRVLEIGAGTGNLTAQLIPRLLYWATDINPLYLMHLENVGRNRPYMRVGFTDAEKVESYPKDQTFDTVICLNVVEHLVDDRGALLNIRSALDAGGRAIILVPCGPHLYGTLDEVLGHQRRYTRESLGKLVASAGFELEKMLEFNRVGVIAWWLNGRVLRRRTFGLSQIKLLNVMTPVFRAVDKMLPWSPLSLIAVIKKNSSAESQSLANGETSEILQGSATGFNE